MGQRGGGGEEGARKTGIRAKREKGSVRALALSPASLDSLHHVCSFHFLALSLEMMYRRLSPISFVSGSSGIPSVVWT